MGALQITVKTLQQKQFKLDVDSSDTILSVKEKIQESQGHAVAQQKLIFSGKILVDDKKVEDYNITEKDFLVVMVAKAKATPASSSAAASSASTPKESATQEKPAETAPKPAETAAAATTPSNIASPASEPPASTPAAPTETTTTATPADTFSQLVTGSQLESVVENMMSMGFERAQCERALRASFNNPDRAVEYLFNGIPEHILNEMNAAQQQPEVQQDTNTQSPTTPNANDANASMNLFAAAQQHAQQQQQQQQQEQNQNLNASLANFRNTPHFQQIRQLVQTNPALLQPLLQSIGQSNPELIRAINADPNAFLQAFLEGAEGEEGAMGPETTTIQVTPEERDAIDRLAALGFDKAVAAEAYFACDKNEELAANYLFEHGYDDFE
ncbi:hypothetical protein G6F46_008413 [Rhizopus delemar]|uniref:UV excision repair protein RAD23 n=3 Tax=Rhizopus TaxID=4842 RepID=I1C797_RHIO9|nr:UV excision repair protein Rad23 [Rhizopus delemar RA 99-880]KAG1455925.1 hypothetical protein G6F55_006794 [Rhizopus delemar]KAG1544094.1 hypothetical protein G6F51_006275 [Rhizopus arrhizus]KAG1501883.1 hypothetical protein G6F54_002743 [Rhizopus delemar]KAG1509098.1 hypothetical protein G6F53_007701 [Rhizopus delemar]|eukprot:EIE84327.1 UV excision repair protein Rad23 [Rhizopus delemar RA 99-880]